ncbi:hypothetical protein Pres01_17390 [Metapseudomonas resinovorans]|uniref:VOC family protein n=1 Tax=Metapseudomonas resinovorans TaxID=53412 RepID=UPI000986256E|nr:VOC family protein [Pseudomonas resinovorans]GLZ85688.1 hypothetical protein Pres01_17390 [Pseudomonas resinovorans]
MNPLGSNTVFHVTDIERSIAFYTGPLGFQLDFRFGEPATYAGLSLGPVCLHISAARSCARSYRPVLEVAFALDLKSANGLQRPWLLAGWPAWG